MTNFCPKISTIFVWKGLKKSKFSKICLEKLNFFTRIHDLPRFQTRLTPLDISTNAVPNLNLLGSLSMFKYRLYSFSEFRAVSDIFPGRFGHSSPPLGKREPIAWDYAADLDLQKMRWCNPADSEPDNINWGRRRKGRQRDRDDGQPYPLNCLQGPRAVASVKRLPSNDTRQTTQGIKILPRNCLSGYSPVCL